MYNQSKGREAGEGQGAGDRVRAPQLVNEPNFEAAFRLPHHTMSCCQNPLRMDQRTATELTTIISQHGLPRNAVLYCFASTNNPCVRSWASPT